MFSYKSKANKKPLLNSCYSTVRMLLSFQWFHMFQRSRAHYLPGGHVQLPRHSEERMTTKGSLNDVAKKLLNPMFSLTQNMNINTIPASVTCNNMVLNRKWLQHNAGIAYFIGKMTHVTRPKWDLAKLWNCFHLATCINKHFNEYLGNLFQLPLFCYCL